MTPRKDQDFYKLKHPWEKVCYLNGMPKPYITKHDYEPMFQKFKCNSRNITEGEQKKTYDAIRDMPWGKSHTAFFMGHPHDRDALTAACNLIRKQAHAGFRDFEFVSPFEELRFENRPEAGAPRELYIMLGVNEKDPEVTNRVRRWMRQPHGASMWIVGVAADPYRWASDTLGCVPDYMFWLKRAGLSIG